MHKKSITGLGILLLMNASLVSGASPKLDLTERFLLLATTKTSTMQKELKRAAAAGYRVLAGSRTSGQEVAVILEKSAAAPNLYEYYLLATRRTSTMEKELNEQAARGFRLLPSTLTDKDQSFGGREILVIMEKAPNAPQHYKYRLLATTRTATMQKEMSEAADDGYVVVGIVSRGEHIVILEKPVP